MNNGFPRPVASPRTLLAREPMGLASRGILAGPRGATEGDDAAPWQKFAAKRKRNEEPATADERSKRTAIILDDLSHGTNIPLKGANGSARARDEMNGEAALTSSQGETQLILFPRAERIVTNPINSDSRNAAAESPSPSRVVSLKDGARSSAAVRPSTAAIQSNNGEDRIYLSEGEDEDKPFERSGREARDGASLQTTSASTATKELKGEDTTPPKTKKEVETSDEEPPTVVEGKDIRTGEERPREKEEKERSAMKAEQCHPSAETDSVITVDSDEEASDAASAGPAGQAASAQNNRQPVNFKLSDDVIDVDEFVSSSESSDSDGDSDIEVVEDTYQGRPTSVLSLSNEAQFQAYMRRLRAMQEHVNQQARATSVDYNAFIDRMTPSTAVAAPPAAISDEDKAKIFAIPVIPARVPPDFEQTLEEIRRNLNPETTLKEHQKLGAYFLSRHALRGDGRQLVPVKLLADDMGLGKTVQAIVGGCILMHDEERRGLPARPVLIIAPPSLVKNWLREIEKFTRNLTVMQYTSTEYTRDSERLRRCHFVVATYSKLAAMLSSTIKGAIRDKDDAATLKHSRRLPQEVPSPRDAIFQVGLFRLCCLVEKFCRNLNERLQVDFAAVILDESHKVKNASSVANKAIRELKFDYAWLLSGTPAPNDIGEVGHQMFVANREDRYSARRLFDGPRCVGDILTDYFFWSKLKTHADLQKEVSKRVILRRTRVLLRQILPPLHIKKEVIRMGRAEWDIYSTIAGSATITINKALQDMMDSRFIRGASAASSSARHFIFTALLRMRQSSDSPLALLSRRNSLALLKRGPAHASLAGDRVCEMDHMKKCCAVADEAVEPTVGMFDQNEEEILRRRKKVPLFPAPACKRDHQLCGDCLEEAREAGECTACMYMDVFCGGGSRLTAKVQRAADIAVEAVKSGSKTVIFAQFLGMGDAIHNHLEHRADEFPAGLLDIARLDGGQRVDERQVTVDKFVNEVSPRVLIVSTSAGGEGLTLVAANDDVPPINRVIVCEPWWNDAKDRQAVSRCWRIGQKHEVTLHRLFCRNTIDTAVAALQATKREGTKDLIEDGDEEGFHGGMRRHMIARLMKFLTDMSKEESAFREKEVEEGVDEESLVIETRTITDDQLLAPGTATEDITAVVGKSEEDEEATKPQLHHHHHHHRHNSSHQRVDGEAVTDGPGASFAAPARRPIAAPARRPIAAPARRPIAAPVSRRSAADSPYRRL